MASPRYLKVNPTGPGFAEVVATTVGGLVSAEKIPALDATGRLSASMLPSGLGTDSGSFVAVEYMSAGTYVSIFDDAGTPSVRKADYSTARRADGYITTDVFAAGTVVVQFEGTNSHLTGLTIGAPYFLGGTGSVTTTPPTASGLFRQYLGTAVSGTAVPFEPDESVTAAVEAPAMPDGALGIWWADTYDSTLKVVPNALATVAPYPLLTRNPRGAFDVGKVGGEGGSGGWLAGGFAGCTITEKYAAGRDGVVAASRAVFAAATSGIRYRATITVAPGTYTMVIDAKSNTGVSQTFLMSKDAEATSVTQTATTSWQQFKYEFTLSGSATLDLRFCRPSSGNGDFVIDKAFLWEGEANTVPADLTLQGDMLFGNSAKATVTTIAGGEIGLTDQGVGAIDFNGFTTTSETTILATVKRVTASTGTAGNRYPFIYDVIESSLSNNVASWSLGEFEGELDLTGSFGGRKVAPAAGGFSPDLFADGGYHVISMSSNTTATDLWIDDVGIALTMQGGGTSMSSRKFQLGSNNVGLAKFKLNALAIYPRKLTDLERRLAINAMINRAAVSSITVTKPTNLVIGGLDSITVGPASNSYLQKYIANITPGKIVRMENEAIAGGQISLNATSFLNFDQRLPFHLTAIPAYLSDRLGRRFIVTILGGANDLQPAYASDDDYLTALWGITKQLRDRGAYVGVATILPKGTAVGGFATHNSRRATANPKIVAALTTKYDFLIDLAANATIGTDAAANNLTYYGDGLHLTDAGHVIAETIFRTALNAIIL